MTTYGTHHAIVFIAPVFVPSGLLDAAALRGWAIGRASETLPLLLQKAGSNPLFRVVEVLSRPS